MTYRHNPKHEQFSREFEQTNPALTLGLIFITLSIYAPMWIYSRNKEFEKIDKDAPHSLRGLSLMLLIPFGWLFTIFIIRKLIFDNLATQILEIVVWGCILALIIKYLFEFCLSFGRITGTNGLYWFLLLPLFIIIIPSMQAELNSHFNRLILRKQATGFYK